MPAFASMTATRLSLVDMAARWHATCRQPRSNECASVGFDVNQAMTGHAASAMEAGLDPLAEAWWGRFLRFALVIGLHGLLLAGILYGQRQPLSEPEPIRFAVRVIELPAPESPAAVPEPPVIPPPPVPPRAESRPVVVPRPSPRPAPVLVAPAPPPLAGAESALAAPVPAWITAVRFDAAYLNNPAPNYPLQSRRRGEQGQVVLRVQVDAHGLPVQVEIQQGSGHARLDAAALDAVRRWRFVPARRGDEAIVANVLVPIRFQME
jgi:protein TonB